MRRRAIAIFGGTFDPVHLGHLRSAQELRERLQLDEVRLVPCHLPPHREHPETGAEHRLAMVELAVAGRAGLVADPVELERDDLSYTVLTLREYRRRWGEDVALCLVMGSDSFNGLHRWREWRALFELAHIVVMERPDHPLQPDAAVADCIASRRLDPTRLREAPAGGFIPLTLTQWPVSATGIRERLERGEAADELLPAGVGPYIRKHKLYGYR